jgi:hypothetical protein
MSDMAEPFYRSSPGKCSRVSPSTNERGWPAPAGRVRGTAFLLPLTRAGTFPTTYSLWALARYGKRIRLDFEFKASDTHMLAGIRSVLTGE